MVNGLHKAAIIHSEHVGEIWKLFRSPRSNGSTGLTAVAIWSPWQRTASRSEEQYFAKAGRTSRAIYQNEMASDKAALFTPTNHTWLSTNSVGNTRRKTEVKLDHNRQFSSRLSAIRQSALISVVNDAIYS